jgi:hypothetical protein
MQAVGNWTKQVYQRFKDMCETGAEENHVTVYRADLNRQEGTREPEENNPQESAIDLEENDPQSDSDDDGNDSTISKSKTKSTKRELVVVNGPYSSYARYVFDCKHVVLIGGGIGITPYASILSSLMAQFRASRIVCKNCQCINYHSKGLVENRRLK